MHGFMFDRFVPLPEIASAKDLADAYAVSELDTVLDTNWYLPCERDDVSLRKLHLVGGLKDDDARLLESITTCSSVALHMVRDTANTLPDHITLPRVYFDDALAEIHAKVPDAHVFLFSDDTAWAATELGLTLPYTPVQISAEAESLELMRNCAHHIVNHSSLSHIAAAMATEGGQVIVPQQCYLPGKGVQQPIWARDWFVMPIRVKYPSRFDYTQLKAGHANGVRMKVGIHNVYEHITTDGFLFKNGDVGMGHNLLKPWTDLYQYGKVNGIDFVTLDQIEGISELDAVLFMDRPLPGNPLLNAIIVSGIPRYLMLYECEVIMPSNWDLDYHTQFDRIFTWNDALVDGQRYIKNNFVTDPECPYDIAVLHSAFEQRKMMCVVAGAKMNTHPNELYSDRIRAVRWFEQTAPEDLDLYGTGWSRDSFPGYCGTARDKLAVMSQYRFSLCYENAKNYPGYITEKVMDCLLAGVVPVYGGAPNIERWLPPDCFIDLRQFGDYFALHDHLRTMDSATHAAYLDRIEHFLASDKSYPFSTRCFISTLTEVMAFDIAQRRGQTPAGVGNLPSPWCLVQDPDTLAIRIESLPASEALPVAEELRRKRIRESGRPDLVVCFSYGHELPVFTRARALWEFYLSHFPNIRTVFVRDTPDLKRGEIHDDGHDLLIGIGREAAMTAQQQADYASTGVWSGMENFRCIYRHTAMYDYLLRTMNGPFYLYQSTITSVLDFRGILAILDLMPTTGCYAGMPGRMATPEYLNGLTFACGTNSLFSSDVIKTLRDRYDPTHEYSTLPNDVWQALILQDLQRIPLPYISFVEPRKPGSHFDDVAKIAHQLLMEGHFHFRVKTTDGKSGWGLREDIDPWIMLKIMETVLATDPSPTANRELARKIKICVNTQDGLLLPRTTGHFMSGPRDIPFTDTECLTILRKHYT